MRAILALLAVTLLSGCAATVNRSGPSEQLSIPGESRANLVVNFTGNDRVVSNEKWGMLKTSWRNALQSEASTAGYTLTEQAGAVRTEEKPGTILLVDVSNFRYLTPAMRFGLGIMTGNAWVDSKVSFLDLQTGDTLGARAYNTSSSAWEGIFSAMTDEQLQAIAKEIISEIRSAKTVPARASSLPATNAAQASNEQQIKQLQQQNLPYDEYQKRYREIMKK